MQSLKKILGIIIIALALYGAYALFVSKKPANDNLPQEFIDEMAREGIEIHNSEGSEGKSALFDTLSGGPPLPSQRNAPYSGASSSIPSALLNLSDNHDDFEDFAPDFDAPDLSDSNINAPNLHSSAPLYGNHVDEQTEEFNDAPLLDEAPAFDSPLPELDEAPAFDPEPNFDSNTALPHNANNAVCDNCANCGSHTNPDTKISDKNFLDENIFESETYSLSVPFSKKLPSSGVIPDEKLIPTDEVFAQTFQTYQTSESQEDFSSVPTVNAPIAKETPNQDQDALPLFVGAGELPLFANSEPHSHDLQMSQFDLPPLDAPDNIPDSEPLSAFETIPPNAEKVPVLEQFTGQFAEQVTEHFADTLANGVELENLDNFNNLGNFDNSDTVPELPLSQNSLDSANSTNSPFVNEAEQSSVLYEQKPPRSVENGSEMRRLPKIVRPLPVPHEESLAAASPIPLPAIPPSPAPASVSPTSMSLASGTVPVNRLPLEQTQIEQIPIEQIPIDEQPLEQPAIEQTPGISSFTDIAAVPESVNATALGNVVDITDLTGLANTAETPAIAESTTTPLTQETETGLSGLSHSHFETQTPKPQEIRPQIPKPQIPKPQTPGVAKSSKKQKLPSLESVFPLEQPQSQPSQPQPQSDIVAISVDHVSGYDVSGYNISNDTASVSLNGNTMDNAGTGTETGAGAGAGTSLDSFPLVNGPVLDEPTVESGMNLPTAPFPSAPAPPLAHAGSVPDVLSSAAPHVPAEMPDLNNSNEVPPIVTLEPRTKQTVQEPLAVQQQAVLQQTVVEPQEQEIRPEVAERLTRIRPILAAGNYRTGHRQATVLYLSDLNAAERESVLPVVNNCGWESFFARRYDPYSFTRTVSATDASPEKVLQSLSEQYRVSPELILKINGIQDVKDLTSKKDLKIPAGPFDAVVLLARKELIVTAHGLFACRFRIGVGRPELITENEYKIEVIQGEVQKYKNPRYLHENGEVRSGDPRNPLGTHWIGLDQAIGFHGTNDPNCIGTDNAPVEGFSLDNRDIAELYDMLSIESKITIKP